MFCIPNFSSFLISFFIIAVIYMILMDLWVVIAVRLIVEVDA